MIDDNSLADDLISGRSKRSPSYHAEYGKRTYGEIKQLAKQKPPDIKARQMKKLIEEDPRLGRKQRGKPRR
jgi:hypothetical protein